MASCHPESSSVNCHFVEWASCPSIRRTALVPSHVSRVARHLPTCPLGRNVILTRFQSSLNRTRGNVVVPPDADKGVFIGFDAAHTPPTDAHSRCARKTFFIHALPTFLSAMWKRCGRRDASHARAPSVKPNACDTSPTFVARGSDLAASLTRDVRAPRGRRRRRGRATG